MAFLFDTQFKKMGNRLNKVIEAEEKVIKSNEKLIKALNEHREVIEKLIEEIRKKR